jgi:hypothetical protein
VAKKWRGESTGKKKKKKRVFDPEPEEKKTKKALHLFFAPPGLLIRPRAASISCVARGSSRNRSANATGCAGCARAAAAQPGGRASARRSAYGADRGLGYPRTWKWINKPQYECFISIQQRGGERPDDRIRVGPRGFKAQGRQKKKKKNRESVIIAEEK